MNGFSCCAAIPCYRHGSALGAVLAHLAPYGLKAVVVDDGNLKEEAELISRTCREHGASLVVHPQNLGKGFAVASAVKWAHEQGFDHMLQIDADGQHDAADIPKALSIAMEHPHDVVSGAPVYDASAPRSRTIGRQITNFFVHVETMSRQIEDAMFGFRVYPVDEVFSLLSRRDLRSRMNFDVEIMVRLYWEGLDFRFFKTRVTYPQDGVSSFRPVDNLLLSMMHTKLCMMMPLGLVRRLHARR